MSTVFESQNFAKLLAPDLKKHFDKRVRDFGTEEPRTFLTDCGLCGAEFKIECWGSGSCPKCGQEHEYEEGHMLVLSDEQKQILLEGAK